MSTNIKIAVFMGIGTLIFTIFDMLFEYTKEHKNE